MWTPILTGAGISEAVIEVVDKEGNTATEDVVIAVLEVWNNCDAGLSGLVSADPSRELESTSSWYRNLTADGTNCVVVDSCMI